MKRIATIALICAAVVLIVIGAVNDQAYSVFSKAVRVCLECIGLG